MARIVAIPFLLALLDRGGPRDCYFAAVIFAGAAITDLHGYLARKRGLVSVLRKILGSARRANSGDGFAGVDGPHGPHCSMGGGAPWRATSRSPGLRSIAASEGVVIAAGESGKAKTALQMVGILMLMIGYPYRMNFSIIDLGVVDLIHIGRWLIYISLVYSLTSAAQYIGLFARTVEAQRGRRVILSAVIAFDGEPLASPPPKCGLAVDGEPASRRAP